MADCCSTTENKAVHPGKRCCPVCGMEGAVVQIRTISHHLRQAWKWEHKDIHYYFCNGQGCDVVYFGDDDSVIRKSQLRTRVGIKETASDAPACYCFGISREDALNDPGTRVYVMEQTRNAQCSCDVSNPSGHCCLKDFPR